MNRLIILWVVALLIGCSKSDENRLPRDAMAPDPEYPSKLSYDPNDKRYIGAPELELRRDRNGFKTDWDRLPIESFDAAFAFAYKVFVSHFDKASIESQLPFLIDYEDGIWIVVGSIPRSGNPKETVTGGSVEMAFIGKTGEVLYLIHTV